MLAFMNKKKRKQLTLFMNKKIIVPFMFLLLGGMFIWTSHLFRNRNIAQKEQLLKTHIDAVAALVKKSVSQGVWTTSVIYSLYEERLITTAHLLSKLENTTKSTQELLDAEQIVVHLKDIQSTAPNGRWGPIPKNHFHKLSKWLGNAPVGEMLESPLLRQYGVICIQYEQANSFALLCHDEANFSMLKQATGIGPLLNDLVTQNIKYVALQDQTGILATAPSNASISRWIDDPLLASAFQSPDGQLRQVSQPSQTLVEGLYPFKMADESEVLLRIAIDAQTFHNMKQNIQRRYVTTVALVGIIELLIMFLLGGWWHWKKKQQQIAFHLRRQEEERKHWELIGGLSATVAHEVRNPIHTMLMTAQRLAAEFIIQENQRDDFQQLLRIFSNEATQLNKIVTDFLELGKPLSLHFESTRIAPFITQIVASHTMRADTEEKSIRTQLLDELEVTLDKQRFTQVVSNLISNALDAMDAKGELTIRATKKDEHLQVLIIDDGVGLTEEQLQQVTTPFVSYKATGTGLGLALVNRYITLHNGTFFLTRNPTKGITAHIEIPLLRKDTQ